MFTAPATLSLLLIIQATAPSSVRLSEVAYDIVGTEPDGEWVELVNTGADLVSLDELRVGDEEVLGGSEAVLAFPPGSVMQPGEVVVIASSAVAFLAAHGFRPDYEIKSTDATVARMSPDRDLGGTQFQLANTADEVLLLDATGLLLDGVSWGRSPPLAGIVNTPIAAEGRTITRERDEVTDDLRPWVVATASAGEVRVFPAPVQTPEEPTPEEPTPEEPTPEEPTPEEPTPEEPTPEEPTPEEPTPEEPTPEEPGNGGSVPRGDDPSVDSGDGVELERDQPFDGPILPETSGGGCASTPSAPWGLMVALLLLARRRSGGRR